MAEIFVDQGLDFILGLLKNGTPPANLYVGLFTGLTGGTVPARGAVGGASPSGWSEVSGAGYARIQIAPGSWGSFATDGNGRKMTAAQVTFTGGAGGWTEADGFFISTHSTSQAGESILCFSNFDSGTPRTLANGDQLKVTPAVGMDG
jgi:hypothetical protein